MSIGFMSDLRLTRAKETFLLDCRAAHLPSQTLRIYRKVLTAFIAYTGDMTVKELQPDHVRMYIATLADNPRRHGRIHSSILAKHYAVIRWWVRWLYAQKSITERNNWVNTPRLRNLFSARSVCYRLFAATS